MSSTQDISGKVYKMSTIRPKLIACSINGTGMYTIGATIAREMAWRNISKKISKKKLVELTGISRSRLNAIEAGVASGLQVDTLMRIATAYQTTPDCMLGLAIDTPSPPATNRARNKKSGTSRKRSAAEIVVSQNRPTI